MLISSCWRGSTAKRYDAIWRAFKDYLRSRRLLLSSVTINVVLDYLSSLFTRGLAYRTIHLHRSVLSATLPAIDGLPVGQHDLVCRLVKGVFQRRPPTRRLYQSWDVGAVFAVFAEWNLPLDFSQIQRKAAFLLAVASARRPSELASLRCSAAFMIIGGDRVRFLPSRLSKTDRSQHLGPPIVVRRLPPEDSASCPVSALEQLLQRRRELGIAHDFIFCDFHAPYSPISTTAFSDRLRWALRRAGISAPPGSTRSVSVSDAFARGVDIQTVLHAGDWSRAQTFYRHYLRPSAASV